MVAPLIGGGRKMGLEWRKWFLQRLCKVGLMFTLAVSSDVKDCSPRPRILSLYFNDYV